MLVEDMSGEAAMSAENLPRHSFAHRVVLLSDESDVVSLRIEDDIFVRLLEANHHIHQLQLSLHHDTGVC